MMKFLDRTLFRFSWVMLAAALLMLPVLSAQAVEEAAHAGESAQILQDFNKQHRDAEHEKSISDKTKQRIMFSVGVALLILVLITGGLGLAMGMYGKPVFVAHMVFAALSVTLGIVHAIIGLVWFYPF
jgi:hypothetical protein